MIFRTGIALRPIRTSHTVLILLSILLLSPGDRSASARPDPAEMEGSEAQGEVSPDSLAVASEWTRQGRRQEAESLLRRLLQSAESSSGDASREVVGVLDPLVSLLWETGRGPAPETLALARRAVRIKETEYGPGAPETAESLFSLGVIHAMSRRFSAADSVFSRVLGIREATEPPGSPTIAQAINALGNVRRMAGDYPGALPLYERALEIAESEEGALGPRAILVRGNLATLLVSVGRYAEGRELLESHIALLERKEHPQLAAVLNGLARIHHQAGDHAATVPIYERALALAVRNEGPIGPDTVTIRGNLAQSLTKLGRYAEARRILEEQIAALEDAGLGETENMGYALSLLAAIAASLGDMQEEVELRERSLAIRQAALPPGHFRIAEALFNLGGALGRQGDLVRQEEMVREAMEVMTLAEEAGNEYIADCEISLCQVASERGDLEAARIHAQNAVAVEEERVGPETPRVAEMLIHLGQIERRLGSIEEARGHLDRAFGILETWIGSDHPLIVDCGQELAQAELADGLIDQGRNRLLAMEHVLRDHLRITLRELPEHQALEFAEKSVAVRELLLSSLDAYPDPDAVTEVWNTIISSRAMVLDEIASRNRRTSSNSPEQAALVAAYRAASTRLANLYVQGPGTMEALSYQALLDEARRETEAAERELSAIGSESWDRGRTAPVELPEVVAALGPGDALVGFVSYGRHLSSQDGETPRHYRAFVLGARDRSPISIELGSSAEIDRRIEIWREELYRSLQEDDRTEKDRYATCDDAGQALRQALWEPISSALTDAKRVFVVPDGQIHLVNLSALPLADGNYLIESGPTLQYLSAERELASNPAPDLASDLDVPGRGVLVLGAPDFAVRRDAPDPAASGVGHFSGLSPEPFRGPLPDCLRIDSAQFTPLPHAEAEAREVAEIWHHTWSAGAASAGSESEGAASEAADNGPIVLLTGSAASEAEFKGRAPGCDALHLATHAFVLDAGCRETGAAVRGIGTLVADEDRSRETGDTPDRIRNVTERNPLLLSGLALAGANDHTPVGPGEEDGVLTAQEIATLDLSSVRWAVLSACDTGTGRVRNGEGVLGLRRAFRIAGVRSLVSTLWSVEDESTRRWMSCFYEGKLQRKLSTAEAVRDASLRVLAERRAAGRSSHPFYWGAFVASGDWR